MKKNKKKGDLVRFLPYYKPYIPIILIDLLCAALSTVCELVFPLIVRKITNTAMDETQTLLFSNVLRLGMVYIMLRLVDTAANYFMAYIGHVTGVRLETDMRRDLFSHLQKQSFSYYDETKVGQIMSRITTDLFDVTEFSHHCPEEFFIAFIKIAGAFVILSGINIWLTCIIFLLLPLMLISVILFRKGMKNAFKQSRVRIGELNSGVEDSLLGIRVVKSFANEDVEEEKFKIGNENFKDIKKVSYRYMARFQASTRFFDGVMYVATIVIGSWFMINEKINAADLVAYLLYIQMLITSIRKIVEFTEQFQKGVTGIERFWEVMDVEPEITEKENAKNLENVRGDIDFDGVSFAYSDRSGEVLSHINLSVKQGENIALVGTSGSGKTTLCSLIPRFYEVSEGSIRIDGEDIRDCTLSSLRRNIGIVQQDVYLFSGTVYDNIAYGKPGASIDDVKQAAKLAGAAGFIESLPNGYKTYVGERGVKLSGGQKQRISIARLFLKNPPILILDEATSALDNESERLVQQSLERLARNRTTFTIAHRLTTVRNASKIIVLTENGIVEQGTHQELIDRQGVYYTMNSFYS